MRCALIQFAFSVLSMLPLFGSAADSDSRVLLFGHDTADLRKAVAEKRDDRHKKSSIKPVLVEFTVSPEPDFIMAYRPDGTFDLEWLLFDPGTTSTMAIPPGTYDFCVNWRDEEFHFDRFSILEELPISGTSHSIEVNASTANHELRLVPVGPDGLSLSEGVTTSNRVLRRVGCDIPIIQDFSFTIAVNVPWDTTILGVYSTLSDKYSLEVFSVRWDETQPLERPAYSYSASYRGGITEGVTVETDPKDWREITLRHHPDPTVERLMQTELVPNHPFANLPDDQLGIAWQATCQAGPGATLEHPFEQKLFRYPRYDPESTLGFLRLRIYEDVGSCSEIHRVRPLFQPPFFSLDKEPKGYLLGSSIPVYEPAGDTFHTGLGPAYWFGKIDDRGDEIGISSSHGSWLVPFLDQTGSRPGYSGPVIPYELYQGDTLVGSGLLPFDDEDDETVLTLDEQGEHTLVLSYDDYWMGQTQGLTTVAATFGAGTDDKNPPYLMRLALRADDDEVAHLQIPGGTVEFLAADDSSGITRVSAWLDTDSGRKDLTVDALGDGRYRIEMGTGGFMNPVGTLSILIEDAEGNTLETGMMMPLRRVARDDESIEVD